MKDLKVLISVSILVYFSLGCGITPPESDFCAIYSPFKSECSPTDPSKKVYELEIIGMLGYQCVSPEDFADIKTYLKEVNRELNKGIQVFSTQVLRWH